MLDYANRFTANSQQMSDKFISAKSVGTINATRVKAVLEKAKQFKNGK